MAKRASTKPPVRSAKETPSTAASAENIEQQVIAFAEQVGRVVGTVQARTEGWLDRKTLTDQIARVRDSATHLLDRLSRNGRQSNAATSARNAAPDPNGRS